MTWSRQEIDKIELSTSEEKQRTPVTESDRRPRKKTFERRSFQQGECRESAKISVVIIVESVG